METIARDLKFGMNVYVQGYITYKNIRYWIESNGVVDKTPKSKDKFVLIKLDKGPLKDYQIIKIPICYVFYDKNKRLD